MWNDQSISDCLIRALGEQQLPPGTRLPEHQLAGLFGVSRETVRRVLLRLGEKKYVELRRDAGARVYAPEPADVADIFHARRTVEAETARLACTRAVPADVLSLRETLAQEHAALAAGDAARAIRLSGEFHLSVARIGGNTLLTAFLAELIVQSSLALALYGRSAPDTCREQDHAGLLRALERGDEEGVVPLMDAHLRGIEAQLGARPARQRKVDLGTALGLSLLAAD